MFKRNMYIQLYLISKFWTLTKSDTLHLCLIEYSCPTLHDITQNLLSTHPIISPKKKKIACF